MGDETKQHARPFNLGDNDPNHDVSAALLSDYSRDRAAALRAKQGPTPLVEVKPETLVQNARAIVGIPEMRSAYPEEYVVRYYVWDNAAKPKPIQIEKAFSKSGGVAAGAKAEPPTIRADNPMQAVNPLMRQTINHAFSTIASQLPGRFRFEETNNLAESDIRVAAVPTLSERNAKVETLGSSDALSGSILLSTKVYAADHGDMSPNQLNKVYSTTLHEILHTLGLKHPQQEKSKYKSLSLSQATFFDTNMTYDKNNNKNKYGSDYKDGEPVGLMPADIKALLALYPIERDVREGVVLVGRAAGMKASDTVVATLTNNLGGNPIGFTPQGMSYQPMPDTANDTLSVTTPVEKKDIVVNGWSGPVHIQESTTTKIRQIPAGTVVTPQDGYSTLIPVRVETIRLSSGHENVSVEGHASIYSPENARPEPTAPAGSSSDLAAIMRRPRFEQTSDALKISGPDNRLSIAASEFQRGSTRIELTEGAQLEVIIRDVAQWHVSSQNQASSVGTLSPESASTSLRSIVRLAGEYQAAYGSPVGRMRWRQEQDGSYNISYDITGKPRTKPTTIHYVLEGATPKDHASFQKLLGQAVNVEFNDPKSGKYIYQAFPSYDAGWIDNKAGKLPLAVTHGLPEKLSEPQPLMPPPLPPLPPPPPPPPQKASVTPRR